MDMNHEEIGPASRRAVLIGAGAAAVAVLAGCQTYDSNAPVEDPGPAPADDPGGAESSALTQTTKVPVGGGVVLDQQRVVITQPKAGTFKCFTAVCTHQGCVVSEVKGGTINCPCHGSAFKVADGSVANGPATKALRAIDITVEGTEIKLA